MPGLLNKNFAVGLKRATGIWLFGKGVRAARVVPVVGSRMIWLFTVRNWLRSPVRQAAGATDAVEGPAIRLSICSKSTKKNSLLRWMGPPKVPPKTFCRKACFFTFARLLKNPFASSFSLRRNSNALPWNLFVPLLSDITTLAPPTLPNSAPALPVTTFTSSRASTLGW